MIEKLVKSIIKYQLGIGTMQEDDVKVYYYGYTLVIEVFLNIVLSLILSVLLEKVKEYVTFLFVFIPLRSFCGGYHAKKGWQCVILSNISVVMTLLLVEPIAQCNISICAYILVYICIVVIIVCFSPVESNNNKLSSGEKKQYRKYALTILLVEMLIEIIFLIYDYQEMFCVIFFVHIIQVVSLLVAYIEKEKSKYRMHDIEVFGYGSGK